MGILDWIRPGKRRHEKHSEFEHTTFGPLKFNSGVGWYGYQLHDDCFHGHFAIVIEGDVEGPFRGATEAFTRLGHNWLALCEPTTYVLTQMLVRHFPDAPTLYFIRGKLWSQTRLTSMHLSHDGTSKLWFQFNFHVIGGIAISLSNLIRDQLQKSNMKTKAMSKLW